ncbi:MAG: UDP-glucose 4-epimerase GalE [Clostridiales bacterium]|nr:UDP-glucose 4-epimerase GalE [Clostridiales bacterium]
MAILVTGGTGYIGSHTAIELINAGYEIVILDNLSNSKIEALNRIKQITGKDVKFYKTDLLDMDGLEKVFKENQITDVMHFAGLKAVGESVSVPLNYYYNNITGTINLLAAMQKAGVKNIVFSSSATVYGVPKSVPIKEDAPLGATNPYGSTKLFIEQIIKDQNVADPSLNAAILRYFNPIGAHESGLIGEDPNGIPNNLVPYITQVAVGRLEKVRVFGNDYPTRDGTGVRDYIHVVDLALGHIAALKKLKTNPGVVIYNLGTGRGYSVLEIINAFSEVVGRPIPYEFAPRRPGDIAASFADPSLAKQELGWEAKRDLVKMCQDSWNWQKKNPNGLE